MPTVRELRGFAATPLCRHEARAAAGRRTRLAIHGLALFLNVMAGWMLLYVLWPSGAADGAWNSLGYGGVVGWAALILVLLTILPMVWSIGLSTSAIAGERESGTLDALLLTPLDRRTLLWAKLLGRTFPARRLMLATIPAYLFSAALVVMALCTDAGVRSGGGSWSWPAAILLLLLVVLAVALLWAALFFQMHSVAAVGLWFSSKYHHSWMAGLITYLAILGPIVLLAGCGGIISLLWPMLLGPSLFDELVDQFDRRALASD